MKKNADTPESIIETVREYLKKEGEENLLPQVADELSKLTGKRRKAQEIVVTSATSLTDSELQKIKGLMKEKTEGNPAIVNTVNKDLIGGFTVQIADWYMDASIKNELEDMKRALLA